MLCPGCHRQLSRAASVCGHCGLPRDGAASPLELVLPDGTRVPVVDEMTLGRAPGSTLVLADPTVSRAHARIAPSTNGGLPVLEDVGSSAGTYVDDERLDGPATLRDGIRIRLGTFQIGVERRRDAAEAGRTIVRPVSAVDVDEVPASATQFGFRPELRSGYALKRLEASEGSKRYVLRDLRTDKFLRLSERDAAVLERLDGQTSLVELIAFAEREFGAAGPARVARLLADLGERGFLAGVDGADADRDAVDAPKSRLRRWMGPHVKEVRGIAPFFEKLYERGGWVLFLRPVLIVLALIAVAGIGCFVYLVLGRYGTPFVVAKKIGLGGLIFLAGRFAFAAVHEVAHGLTMASYGRRIDRAGIKAIFILPYVFVDTSEAWFEPRRHRIAVSAAGPVSDFAIGGTFAILSTVVGGTLREVFFQLAFSAYIGGLFNLNPFLDRDGYHILVDVLREPGLKKRAKAQFERRVGGDKRATDNRALARYSIAAAVWSIVGALFAIGMSLRYEKIMVALAPKPVVYTIMATIWLVLFIPFFLTVGKPMLAGRRNR
ncbi:MAG: putative peptide zinc metalloprotease protein [Solirubrobacteraceae bacterium]|jgi:putative peptide zinc metalloprotease protein|nr:putative peptide zinc metalloprotease protein [Solirubrobacteraceae bacterium]